MNITSLFLAGILFASYQIPATCRKVSKAMTYSSEVPNQPIARVPADVALKVAHSDAEQAYRNDLSAYRVCLALEQDGWHVDYELKDPSIEGGGPHYVIDSKTGKILWKKYQQ
jgi:hypothetical protein